MSASNCREYVPECTPDLVVTNPPWGIKQRRQFPPFQLIPSLQKSWSDLGEFLWRQCKGESKFAFLCRLGKHRLGAKAYFPCNHPFLYKELALFVTERHPVWINGTHLGIYGVHLHDTDAINKHKAHRKCQAVDDPRTKEERREEIQAASEVLRSTLPTIEMGVKDKNKGEVQMGVLKPKRKVLKPTYSWKYQKYVQTVR